MHLFRHLHTATCTHSAWTAERWVLCSSRFETTHKLIDDLIYVSCVLTRHGHVHYMGLLSSVAPRAIHSRSSKCPHTSARPCNNETICLPRLSLSPTHVKTSRLAHDLVHVHPLHRYLPSVRVIHPICSTVVMGQSWWGTFPLAGRRGKFKYSGRACAN